MFKQFFYKKFANPAVLFFSVLLLKILLGLFFASDFPLKLFIPFIKYFIGSGFENPYAHSVSIMGANMFPYPAMMLYVETMPTLLLGWISDSPYLALFLFRLPLLAADLVLLWVLYGWLQGKHTLKLLILYWCCPVLIYINYVHGQLDAIPIAFLFLSLRSLLLRKTVAAAFLIALSVACKTSVLLAFPFMTLFLYSKRDYKGIARFALIALTTFLLINSPFLTSKAFQLMVFENSEQTRLFLAAFPVSSSGLTIYLIPLLLLTLFVYGARYKYHNKDILIIFTGFAFSTVLLFVPPVQGWYYWVLPFLSYFYVKESKRANLLFLSLMLAYFLYFALWEASDYRQVFQVIGPSIAQGETLYEYLNSGGGFPAKIAENTALSVLFALLLLNCALVYERGLKGYSQYEIAKKPFVVGIAGNSGAGKTTFSKSLERFFGEDTVAILHGDDVHKWERGNENWKHNTPLNPKANSLYKNIHDLKMLKKGKYISREIYNHNTGKFDKAVTVLPTSLIIFEGLHSLYLKSQREALDLKIFFQPSLKLLTHWKIVRDKKERGYTAQEVLHSLEKRKKDSADFIDIQSEKADILIEQTPVEDIANLYDMEESPEVRYLVTLTNSLYCEGFADKLGRVAGLTVSHKYINGDRQLITIEGDAEAKELARLAKNLESLERWDTETEIPRGSFGAVLLLLVHCIFDRAKLNL